MEDRGSILVVGGESFLGQGLVNYFKSRGFPTWQTTRRRNKSGPQQIFLDLSLSLEDFDLEHRFDIAFLCAGVTSVQACADQPQSSYEINVTRTLALVEILRRQKTFLVYPSSSYVFDGRTSLPGPNSSVYPSTEYGRQKAAVEKSLSNHLEQAAIVRLTKVLHPRESLVAHWAQALRNGQTVRASSTGSVAPLTLDFAVEALSMIASRRYAGITQVSSKDEMTYLAAARYLAQYLGRDSAAAEPDPAAHESLPIHAALDVSRLEGEIGMAAPKATAALDATLIPAAL